MDSWEGIGLGQIVYVDGDGVATNHGIRFDSFQDRAQSVLGVAPTFENFKKMTRAQHKAIAKWYWIESGAEFMKSGRIGATLAEAFWGGGYAALKNFQQKFNEKFGTRMIEDGVPRRETAQAFNKIGESRLFWFLIDEFDKRYHDLVKRKPSLEKNLKGWLLRLHGGDKWKRSGFVKIFENYDTKKKCCFCRCSELQQAQAAI